MHEGASCTTRAGWISTSLATRCPTTGTSPPTILACIYLAVIGYRSGDEVITAGLIRGRVTDVIIFPLEAVIHALASIGFFCKDEVLNPALWRPSGRRAALIRRRKRGHAGESVEIGYFSHQTLHDIGCPGRGVITITEGLVGLPVAQVQIFLGDHRPIRVVVAIDRKAMEAALMQRHFIGFAIVSPGG